MTQTMPHSAQLEAAPLSLNRLRELESENIRLHLLVSELLIKNQQLREAQRTHDPA
ncbi:hypothetical protein SAMN05421770_1011132 [Granulicella rosea]|uniref:Uncharacterized protein n=1 Tax=Granulicella rosea TaxID=474952 RepID=A0A239ESX6_9BACT|nr:hypothetical protein [Granulicella rosea]SNS47511.1 hypothetical protein SAMN05421770_1011132 [Granulicella rosea]